MFTVAIMMIAIRKVAVFVACEYTKYSVPHCPVGVGMQYMLLDEVGYSLSTVVHIGVKAYRLCIRPRPIPPIEVILVVMRDLCICVALYLSPSGCCTRSPTDSAVCAARGTA